MILKQLLLFITLIMLLKPLWSLIEYAANYDYIVENLCENKDKPKLNCNGKCYLAKMLAEESEEADDNPFKNELSKYQIPIISCTTEEYTPLLYFDFVINNHEWYSRMNSGLFTIDILHPPQFL